MTRQEQLTSIIITFIMLSLSIYIYIDFYINGNTHSAEALSEMTNAFNTHNEHLQNISSEVTVKVLSEVSQK